MKLNLIVLTAGKQQGKTIPVRLPQFLVGRDPQCQLRPASPLISKRHCAIIQRDGKAYLRDFDSTNGSYVNNERVRGEQELHDQDQLKIGPIELQISLAPTPSVSKPTPPPPTKESKKLPGPGIKKAPPGPDAEGKPEEKAPAPVPSAPAASGGSTDEDIAAMLLFTDGVEGDADSGASADVIPEGSTVFDLPVPSEFENKEGEEGNKQNMLGKVKAEQENTSSAAKSILEQYMKRPRT
jgi:hypothetical protein